MGNIDRYWINFDNLWLFDRFCWFLLYFLFFNLHDFFFDFRTIWFGLCLILGFNLHDDWINFISRCRVLRRGNNLLLWFLLRLLFLLFSNLFFLLWLGRCWSWFHYIGLNSLEILCLFGFFLSLRFFLSLLHFPLIDRLRLSILLFIGFVIDWLLILGRWLLYNFLNSFCICFLVI